MTTSIDIKAISLPLRFDAHGVCRVADTRVTLLTMIDAFLEGGTAEEIYREYPSVSLADVYAVIAFYLGHRDEIDAYLDTCASAKPGLSTKSSCTLLCPRFGAGFWHERRSRRDFVPRRRKPETQIHQRLVAPESARGRCARPGCRIDRRGRSGSIGVGRQARSCPADSRCANVGRFRLGVPSGSACQWRE